MVERNAGSKASSNTMFNDTWQKRKFRYVAEKEIFAELRLCYFIEEAFCRTADEHPNIMFLKVNFDENKPFCKSLNGKVLPRFHFYLGADGLLESFSCTLAKFQKIKDAIELHNTPRCSIGPPERRWSLGDLNLESSTARKEKLASGT